MAVEQYKNLSKGNTTEVQSTILTLDNTKRPFPIPIKFQTFA